MEIFGIAVLNNGVKYTLNGDHAYFRNLSLFGGPPVDIISTDHFIEEALEVGLAHIDFEDDDDGSWHIINGVHADNLIGLQQVQQWLRSHLH